MACEPERVAHVVAPERTRCESKALVYAEATFTLFIIAGVKVTLLLVLVQPVFSLLQARDYVILRLHFEAKPELDSIPKFKILDVMAALG